MNKKIFSIFLLILITIFFLKTPYAFADTVTDNAFNYLKTQQDSTGRIANGFSSPSQWAAIAFAANGINTSTITNPVSLYDFLLTDVPTTNSATEWETRILAIVAIDGNPSNFSGTNYIQNLESFYDGTQIGDTCALNDDIFGLLAFIISGDLVQTSKKQAVLDHIISKQDANGGFGWSAPGCAWYDTAPDMTAAAIQSLQTAKNNGLTNSNLDTSITLAKTYLLTTKNSDGGFGYFGSSDTDTTGWALMALNILGEESSTEATNAKNYLLSKQSSSDGGFQSFDWGTSTFVSNSTTTAQTLIALLGKSWVIKIYSSTSATSTPAPTPTPAPVPTSPTTIPSSDLKNLITNGYFSLPSTATTSATPSITTAQKVTINVSVGSGTNSVVLPQGVIIRRSDGANIDTNTLSTDSVSVGSVSGLGSNLTVDGAFQWGIPGIGLEFTSPITINIYVGTSLNGQTLNIQRSIATSSGWTNDGIVDPKTCVVSEGICSFTTIKASYFAATRNTSTSSSTSQSSASPTPTPTPSPTPSASTPATIAGSVVPTPSPQSTGQVLGESATNNIAEQLEKSEMNSKRNMLYFVISLLSFVGALIWWKIKIRK